MARKAKVCHSMREKMFQKSAKIRYNFVNEGPDQRIERRVIAMAFFQSNFLSKESSDQVKERRPDEFLKRRTTRNQFPPFIDPIKRG